MLLSCLSFPYQVNQVKWSICLFLLALLCLLSCEASKNTTTTTTSAYDFSSDYRSHCKKHPNKCVVVDVSINNLSKHNLIHSLENVTFLKQEQELLANHYIYYVAIAIKDLQNTNNTINGNSNYIRKQYEELDAFILERPWWKVQQYPVIYQHQSRALPLLLEHVPLFLTQVSKTLVAINFPPKEECLKKKMYISSAAGSWGNDISVNLGGFFYQYVDYIHAIIFQNHGNGYAKEGYVDKDKAGCNEKINLRTCLFLETTNCSYPDVFNRKCGDGKCGPGGVYAAGNRSYIGVEEPPEVELTPSEDVFPQITNWKSTPSITVRSTNAFVINMTNTVPIPNYNNLNTMSVYYSHWLFGIAYKYNYHLGVRIQEYLQDFYTSYRKADKPQESFSINDHCIAAHIRKGDRHLPGVDMIEWCKNHTKYNANGQREFTGQWIHGEPLSFGNYADMGCGSITPFGTVTLQHVVNASLLLANETLYSSKHRLNVMIMTDELSSLKEEMVEFDKSGYARSKVRIIVLPTKQENVHKSRQSWQGSLEWWAGIEAIKQCSGFVAHGASAASGAIAFSMCYSHDGSYMKCPPAYFFS